MKKIILTTTILSAFLIGCNENKVKTSPDAPAHSEIVHTEETAHHDSPLDNSWTNEIKLDNGKKWEANKETNIGVEKMLDIIKERDPKTVNDYHEMASQLNDHKNYVVKECTMTGPSHDNLHVFLHPLIEKIDALGKVETVKEGSEIVESVRENLDAYYNYFK
jgi:hypothetical protein